MVDSCLARRHRASRRCTRSAGVPRSRPSTCSRGVPGAFSVRLAGQLLPNCATTCSSRSTSTGMPRPSRTRAAGRTTIELGNVGMGLAQELPPAGRTGPEVDFRGQRLSGPCPQREPARAGGGRGAERGDGYGRGRPCRASGACVVGHRTGGTARLRGGGTRPWGDPARGPQRARPSQRHRRAHDAARGVRTQRGGGSWWRRSSTSSRREPRLVGAAAASSCASRGWSPSRRRRPPAPAEAWEGGTRSARNPRLASAHRCRATPEAHSSAPC